jgi:alpha-1,6-mannosyltransferase
MHPCRLVDTTLFYSPTSGGVRRYLTAKHAWLAAQAGWQHTLLVPGRSEHLEPGGVSTLAGLPVPGSFNYRLPLSTRRWARLLDALEPDLLEAGDAFHPAWAACRVAHRRAIPCAAFFHSDLPRILGRRFGGRLSERLAEHYVRALYERFDVVFAPSRLMVELLGQLGVANTMHQPLGVDEAVFHPRRRGAWLRERLGLRACTRVLVYAGRFTDEKNVPVLRRAFAHLGRPYHLLMIGGHRTRRLAPNITLLPYRRDSVELAQWLASSDALVHAGTRETFGLVILEAMACGRPVVAVRSGAVPELLTERCGLLAEPDDARSLADAVAALYDRDLGALGRSARERVLQRFTWQRIFQRQLGIYRALLAGRSASIGLEEELAETG